MAAVLRRELGVRAELIRGHPGEFSVWVDSREVIAKNGGDFPAEAAVVAAVQAALQAH